MKKFSRLIGVALFFCIISVNSFATITVLPTRNEYTATAGQTTFFYTFKIFSDTDLNVYVTPAGQEPNDTTDIVTPSIVGGVGDTAGGTITIAATSAGDLVTIVSDIPENREVDYQNNGSFRPTTVNNDFDRVVSLTKQILDTASRTLVFPQSQQNAKELSLPPPVAGLYMRWKTDETGLENTGAPSVTAPAISHSSVLDMQGSATLVVGDVVQTTAYYSTQDGGSALYEIVVGGTGTNDGGSFIDLSGSGLQAKLILSSALTPEMFGAIGDGDGAGGGTNRATELQNYFTYAIANGGEYASSKGVFYRCDSPLTMLNTNPLSTLRYVLDLKGTIDFTNIGLTGTALSLGATTSGNAAPLGAWDIRTLNLWGPESVNPVNPASPETSVVGLNLSNAINVKIGTIKSQRFYMGYKSSFTFPLEAGTSIFSQNWIGMYQGSATNNQTWMGPQANECKFGYIIQDENTNKIVQQTYISPRAEGSKVGFVIDAGVLVASERIRGISIITPYIAGLEYDGIRIGRVPDLTDASVRGIDNTANIINTVIMDGDWALPGFSATHSAIVFPAAATKVLSTTCRIPVDDAANAVVGVIAGGTIHYTGTPHSGTAGVQWQNRTKIYDVGGNIVSLISEDGSARFTYLQTGNLGLNGQSTFGTSASGVLAMANAVTAPSTAIANGAQIFPLDDVDSKAVWHMQNEGVGQEIVAGVLYKDSTGDPGGVREAMFVINTVDNNIRMYADGAFRTLATW